MKNQEALEIISSVLNRTPINKAEQAGLNAALWQLKQALVDGDPLDELEPSLAAVPNQTK